MAKLSPNKIIDLIKSPVNMGEISRAQRKKKRNNLHTQAVTDVKSIDKAPGHRDFLLWVRDLLGSKQNYNRYKSLYRPPVSTNELAESIFSEFQKIFDAQDKFLKFEFEDPELEQDFNEYREKISDEEFMEEDGFQTFKSSIDSFVIIDMPKINIDEEGNPIILPGADERSEPYPLIIDIDKVVDADTTKKRKFDPALQSIKYTFNVEYLIFKDGKDKIIAIDDDYYRVFIKRENSSDYVLDGEYPHLLGYCPAKSFWNTPLNNKSKIEKLGRIDNSLSEFDWLLFWTYARKYLEMYAAFPIYVKYRDRCNYRDMQLDVECKGGWLDYKENGQRKRKECPSCSEKISPGPGNVIEADVPKDGDDVNLMETPLKVIPAETTSLEYVSGRQENLEDKIFKRCVGQGGEPNNNQAQNEKQITSQYESKQNVLMNIKRNFEIIHHFVLDTVARLRYGDNYVQGTINYGTEFFLKDVKVQEEEYKSAKESGLPMFELANRRSLMTQTKYRNNPDMLLRANIMSQLEPFPDMTIESLVDFKSSNPILVSDSELLLKVHFSEFISKFEREQTSLIKFGSQLSMTRRINLIREELMKYVSEVISLNPNPPIVE